MNHRALRFATLATVISLSAAGVAQATDRASESQLLDACIQHFIADNLTAYQGKVSVVKDSTAGFQPLTLGTRHLQVQVSAFHRNSGTNLGTMTCTVDGDGKVLSMKGAAIDTAKLPKAPALATTNE